MKVVQFLHGLSLGGAETLVKDYALFMKKAGVDVVVLCYEYQGSPWDHILEENGVRVTYIDRDIHCASFSRNLFVRIWRKILRTLYLRIFFCREKPDIVHFHLSLSKIVRGLGLPKDVRIFYTHHYNAYEWFASEKMRYDIDSMKYLVKHYDVQIIALNEEMRRTINEGFNINNTIILNNLWWDM